MDEKKVTIDFLIRQNFYKYQRLYNNKAMEYGVTISVAYVLLIVEKEGTFSTQLGPKMGMEPTSLSRTLKLMEDDGLIKRETVSNDRRKVLVFLTQKGIEKRKIAKEVVLGFDNKLTNLFSKDELILFYKVMNKIDYFLENELKNK